MDAIAAVVLGFVIGCALLISGIIVGVALVATFSIEDDEDRIKAGMFEFEGKGYRISPLEKEK